MPTTSRPAATTRPTLAYPNFTGKPYPPASVGRSSARLGSTSPRYTRRSVPWLKAESSARTRISPGAGSRTSSWRISTARARGNHTAAATLWAVFGRIVVGLAVEDHVLAAGDEPRALEGDRIAQPFDGEIADGVDALPDDLRRDAYRKTVHELAPQRGGDDAAAALDEERLDAFAPQLRQHGGEVYRAIGRSRRTHDASTARS